MPIRRGVDGKDISPSSVTAEDLDVGTADLAALGIKFPQIVFGAEDDGNSTTSSTYGTVSTTSCAIRIQWDDWAEAGNPLRVIAYANVDGTNDQLDVRLRNTDDSENVFENTGITSSGDLRLASTTYTPTTTDGVITLLFQIRNNDNASSVSFNHPTVIIGADL